MAELIKNVLSSTGITSEQYKVYMNDIIKSIHNLDHFTDDLQSKVDGILKAQQKQFVNSYKQHMMKIKQDFKKLEYELKVKQKKIADYENEGRMSILLKRINFLEMQQKKMLDALNKKNADLRQLQLQNKINKSQIRNLQEKVKGLLKNKSEIEEKMSQNIRTHQSIPTFSTQICLQNSDAKSLSKILSSQRNYKKKMRSLREKSLVSESTLNPQFSSGELNKLHRQNKSLRKQNRQLVIFNTKFMQGTAQMQNFFIETVNEIKKNISVRKNVRQVSLEDFRKQDKLQLLIRVLSNDQIIVHLYEKIFGKKIKTNFNDLSVQMSKSSRKIKALRMAKPSFPAILQRQSLLRK